MPKTAKERDAERTTKHRDAGLVRITPTYWVVAAERKRALEAINKAMRGYKSRARRLLGD